MGPRTAALLLAPTITLLVLVSPTQAGIVVLEDGGSIVGKFGPGDVTDQEIFLRGVEGQQGSTMKVDRRRVRWFDPAANAPTDAYFALHLEAKLEPRWDKLRQEYIARRNNQPEPLPPFEVGPWDFTHEELGPPLQAAHLTVRPPAGWKGHVDEGITMLVAPRKGEHGYAPRVHVFSVEAPSTAADEQLTWIQAELRRLAVAGGYHQEELYRLRPVGGGHDQKVRTESRASDGRSVWALRRICFRNERVYFFAAYADARDYDELKALFEKSLESVLPDEDARQP